MSDFTKNEKDVLQLLLEHEPDYLAPTKIAQLLHPGTGRHSAWASPICKRLVAKGGLERSDKGHYRVKPSVIIRGVNK